VVLSLGMLPDWNPAKHCSVSRGKDGFIKQMQPKIAPTLTGMDGVFVAGVAAGPKDIVDTIAEAGAAATEASKYMAALEQGRRAA
jgi:heterodisulfide reductase subunit A2